MRYSLRLYPNGPQQAALARAFGCARVVFNDALRIRKDAHEVGKPYPKIGDLSKQVITEAKKAQRQSVRFTANARWSITAGGDLRLPKIGEVRVKWSRALPSTPATATVLKDAAGRYF
ncbi:helix-turn-helix domain-containing protein [Streptomyces malaysiensis]|uniref:helix-turn-helix domain-containing protein n=1 Tax=Streptomyces malaysiensis TaxID=92644 RepID=UPI002B2CFEA8|nr:helix-turn-helix domain-containing protein [Streptomyces malaysiensis]